MFTFDNLAGVDNRAIQVLMRSVESDLLMTALKGADEEVERNSSTICPSARGLCSSTIWKPKGRSESPMWKMRRRLLCVLLECSRIKASWCLLDEGMTLSKSDSSVSWRLNELISAGRKAKAFAAAGWNKPDQAAERLKPALAFSSGRQKYWVIAKARSKLTSVRRTRRSRPC